MIKEMKMYTVICDNCGIDFNEGSEYSCWGAIEHAEQCAAEIDWLIDDDNHYCDDCWGYDDDDKLTLSKKRLNKYNQETE